MPRYRAAAAVTVISLLAAALAGTATASAATPAATTASSAAPVEAPTSVVDTEIDEDSVPMVFRNNPPATTGTNPSAYSTASKGFLLSEPGTYTFNQSSYVLRLINNGYGNADLYRSAVKAVAANIRVNTGITISVAEGTIPDAEDGGYRVGRDEVDGEILLSIDARLCGGDADVLGCGGPSGYYLDDGTVEISAGRVWMSPQVSGASQTTKQEVLAHELGHVLGLAHFEQSYQGAFQRMYPSQVPVPRMYMPGDINGLLDVKPVANPIGKVETIRQSPGGVIVGGWTLDPNAISSNTVHLFVDGKLRKGGNAYNPRGDIAARYPALGAKHGFTLGVPLGGPDGPKTVCGFGINLPNTRGGSAAIGCATINFKNSPSGSLDSVKVNGSRVEFAGWTTDPNTGRPTQAHIYVDGVGKASITADKERGDLSSRGYGTKHGFSSSISKPAKGTHQVCAYAINVSGTPGSNALIGCKTIKV